MTATVPAESMALTVALAQVLRGEEPTPNVATLCVLALARIEGRHDYLAAGGAAASADDPTSTRLEQVGWMLAGDDQFLSLEEVEEYGHCYGPLQPVFVRVAAGDIGAAS